MHFNFISSARPNSYRQAILWSHSTKIASSNQIKYLSFDVVGRWYVVEIKVNELTFKLSRQVANRRKDVGISDISHFFLSSNVQKETKINCRMQLVTVWRSPWNSSSILMTFCALYFSLSLSHSPPRVSIIIIFNVYCALTVECTNAYIRRILISNTMPLTFGHMLIRIIHLNFYVESLKKMQFARHSMMIIPLDFLLLMLMLAHSNETGTARKSTIDAT